MKILTIIGARPQFIKVAAVSRILRAHPSIREVLLHTGQHYDENMSEVFFRQLHIPEPDYNIEAGSGTHAVQTGKILKGVEEILMNERPDVTLVYGDTNSTLAGALAAAKLTIPVAHVEAGVRSFNRAMPEEINRIVTDRIASLLFAPTPAAIRNLRAEGLEDMAHFTGDVMYDSVLYYQELLRNEPERYRTPGIPEKYFLATIHRAENTDHPERLKNLLSAFTRLSFPVVLPLHPRTRKIIESLHLLTQNVILIEPVGYLPMLKLTMDAQRVLTDSGGLQKEAYFLNVPCITLRTETEWVETLHDGWNIIAGTIPEIIVSAASGPVPCTVRNHDFGDGNAARKIMEILLGF